MIRPRRCALGLATVLLTAAPAAAQFAPLAARASDTGGHVGVELGLGLGGLSYTRSVLTPTAEDYVLTVRGVVDPTGSFTADLGATLRPGRKLSYSAYATATTRDRNRFYGWGNGTEPSGGADFHRLDQFRLELGLAARLGLGGRNEIVAGPFFRRTHTDSGVDLVDPRSGETDGGVMQALRPYGSGAFRQLGFRTDLRLATEGPEEGSRTGVRFYGGGRAYAAALDMREPVLSLYADA